MDRNWMYLRHRFQPKFTNGLELFLDAARQHLNRENKTRCPCRDCKNGEFYSVTNIRRHILTKGFQLNYSVWTEHGEYMNDVDDDDEAYDTGEDENENYDEGDDDDSMMDMLDDLQRNEQMSVDDEERNNLGDNSQDNDFDHLFNEALKKLYPGCKKFSALSFILKLMHTKVVSRWSNKSFNMLLKILKDSHPEGAAIPSSLYEAKKMLRGLDMGYESIHACKHDCVLFWKENEKLEECPECHEPRYMSKEGKWKKIPQKVLRYFPVKPRLKRLFMSRHTATDMKWHKLKRKDEEGYLRHPADAKQWKKFDADYPDFAVDCRNVRLGLATDGFNPFGNMSTSYSMWPVILVPYNLPPWKCMKGMFSMMSLLIPGPRAPGKDIDVYLRPLIDELRELCDVGVEAFDVSLNQRFTLRACVIWTINDFPAYGNLSGWSTKGYKACPVCNEDITSDGLRGKVCYMGHRRSLAEDHEWRWSLEFNGKVEDRPAPRLFSGDDKLKQLERVHRSKPGKHPSNPDLNRKREPCELNWTRKTIFYELPYWSKLEVQNNIDVMHCEKNVGESVVGTLLDIDGKTKDTHKARLDLADMGIRKELHLKQHGNRWKKPPAIYTLKMDSRRSLCRFFKHVKFPDGYVANISKNVNILDGKIHGLKSHDWHVLLQRLLPVGIRHILDKDVCTAVVELCGFFQQICAKTLKVSDLERMEREIVLVLCKLERIFPPAFFDVMLHLVVHLPREAILGGLVSFRWMYPIERNLGTYKKYVSNRARPEGSIAETYIVNEAITLCSMYFRGVETRFNLGERNDDFQNEDDGGLSVFSQRVRPFSGKKYVLFDEEELKKAQWCVLLNCEEVEPYLREHEGILKQTSGDDLHKRQDEEFPNWFQKRMGCLVQSGEVPTDDYLYCLASKPDPRTHIFTGCVVNGFRYHIKELDDRRTTQNSGIYVPGVYVGGTHDYYGILLSIVRLSYVDGHHVYLFKCKWFNTDETERNVHKRVQRDYNLLSINTDSVWYKDEPFILANTAQQVFYLDDPKLGHGWKVVQKAEMRHVWDVPELDAEEGEEISEQESDIEGTTYTAQQDEFNVVHWSVQEEELENPQLHQEDVEAEVIDSNLDNMIRDGRHNDSTSDEYKETDTDDVEDEEIFSSDDDYSD